RLPRGLREALRPAHPAPDGGGHLTREGDRFVATAGGRRIEADNVVVAMANYQKPRVPACAREMDPGIRQLHAHGYRNPAQLQDGGLLVVGAGNSGADIAIELARTRPTWLAGTESGHVPFPIDGVLGRFVLIRIVRFIGHHVLTVSTPWGRKARPQMLSRAAPLIRVKPDDLVRAGVLRVPRVAGARDGRPLLERGIVAETPGLYFVGLHSLYAMTSATLAGVGRDAARVVGHVAGRRPKARAA